MMALDALLHRNLPPIDRGVQDMMATFERRVLGIADALVYREWRSTHETGKSRRVGTRETGRYR